MARRATTRKADETNIANCMPIQLPFGNIRAGLNLKKNKDVYKKEITLYGNIEKYFGITGLKNVSYALVGTKSFGTKPGQPVTPSTDILNETFAESIGSFTIANEKDMPQGLKYVWWEVLTPSKWPSNKDWISVNSTIDLSAYAGKKDVRIAFQYKSSSQSAGTWELKNLVVK